MTSRPFFGHVACVAVILATASGCQVVKPGTDAVAYQKLASWKTVAENVTTTSANYKTAQEDVNAWITAKQTQLAVAGASLFGDVDLSDMPKSLDDEVDKVRVPGPSSTAKEIADYILQLFKGSRAADASAVSGKLEAFKWPGK